MISPHIVKTHTHPSAQFFKKSKNILEPIVHSIPKQHIYSYYQEPITERELKRYSSSIPVHFRTVETQNPLNRFMSTLNLEERRIFQKSIDDIKILPFVKEIQFDELETPTLIIRLSHMNRDTEEKIYQIEYDLLKNFNNNIDFLVLP